MRNDKDNNDENDTDKENDSFSFPLYRRIQGSFNAYLLLLENPLDSWRWFTLHIDVKLNIASSLDCGLLEVCAVDARLDC